MPKQALLFLIFLFYLPKKFWSMHFSCLFLVLFSQFYIFIYFFMVMLYKKVSDSKKKFTKVN